MRKTTPTYHFLLALSALALLGGTSAQAANDAPVVTITAPIEGDFFTPGELINFTGTAIDTEDGDISESIHWTADLDGLGIDVLDLGIGLDINASLPTKGSYEIKAEVTDSGAIMGSAVVGVLIDPLAGYEVDFSFELNGSTDYGGPVDYLTECNEGLGAGILTSSGCLPWVGFYLTLAVGNDPKVLMAPDGIADWGGEVFNWGGKAFETACGPEGDTGYRQTTDFSFRFNPVGRISSTNPCVELNGSVCHFWGARFEKVFDAPNPGFTGSGTVSTVRSGAGLAVELSDAVIDAGDFCGVHHASGGFFTEGVGELFPDIDDPSWVIKLDADAGGARARFHWNTTSQERNDIFSGYFGLHLTGEVGEFGAISGFEVSGPYTFGNTAPTADGDVFAATEDTVLNVPAIGVLDGDTDPETDPLTAVMDTDATNGTVVLALDGSFSYTPVLNTCGADSFTYHANDGALDSNIATVTLNVGCVNDAPSFTVHDSNVNEDSVLQSNVTIGDSFNHGGGADEAGQKIARCAISGLSVPGGLLAGGPLFNNTDSECQVTYEPAPDANGSFSFNLGIEDSGSDVDPNENGSPTQSVTITIKPINDAPSITVHDSMVLEDAGAQAAVVVGDNFNPGPAEADTLAACNVPSESVPVGLLVAGPTVTISGSQCHLAYIPADDAFGDFSFMLSAEDSGNDADPNENDSAPQSVTITIKPVNDAPVASDNDYTHDEDTTLTGNVIADGTPDSDVDGDSLQAVLDDDSTTYGGLLTFETDGSFSYDPEDDYCNDATPKELFTYHVNDGPTPIDGTLLDSDIATVTITVTCRNDLPVVTDVDIPSQTSDYSDLIQTVMITATDVDDTALTLSESGEPILSMDSLSLSSASCIKDDTPSPTEDGSTCAWSYGGQVLHPGTNLDDITFTAHDPADDGVITDTHTLNVHPEDATVLLDGGNTTAVEVPVAGGASGPFTLVFTAWETNNPDAVHGGALHFGDLNNAEAFMSLVPVGPGSPVTVDCSLHGIVSVAPAAAGYGQILTASCNFDGIAVNTYEILAEVDGLSNDAIYYYGFDEGVFVVNDPSLGFTTGGGWFYWPETDNSDLTGCGPDGYAGDKTNFGFNIKYNNKRKNVKGNLLLMRHTVDADCLGAGNWKVKSNALNGLSIGDGTDNDGEFGWAALSGKSVFRTPELDEGGNHPFLLYVEDHDEQGCDQTPADQFWIEIKDKDGIVVLQLNGAAPVDNSDPAGPADGDDEPIECGNISVPHKPKGKSKKKR